MRELYIGLMSGTSMDGVDAALVDFTPPTPQVIATHSEAISPNLKSELLAICTPGEDEINRCGQLDVRMGRLFAAATLALLKKSGVAKKAVRAIGSHGQTIRHQPKFDFPFTLQIGDPNVISELTGITTIADFRRRDMASGGQGAPLVPAFHNAVLRHPTQDRAVVNIGGIANVTFLPADINLPITGFDTGPGNMLLDAWVKRHLNQDYDKDGGWGKSGNCDKPLLGKLLADPYFSLPPPKSTGREYFNLHWLETKLSSNPKPQDIQNTLLCLTATSIMQAIDRFGSVNSDIILCGGGVHNKQLVDTIHALKNQHKLYSSADFGIDPDWMEAMAFAWLAKQTLEGKPGNLPAVTGAKNAVILGGIYLS